MDFLYKYFCNFNLDKWTSKIWSIRQERHIGYVKKKTLIKNTKKYIKYQNILLKIKTIIYLNLFLEIAFRFLFKL